MKKKILFLLGLTVFAISCSSNTGSDSIFGGSGSSSSKPLSANIPSTDKYKLNGTSVNASLVDVSKNVSATGTTEVSTTDPTTTGTLATDTTATTKTYSVVDRLYSTTWFQTEKEIDDGVLEEETEFIFFSQASEIYEVEVENGLIDRPDNDDYGVLTFISDFNTTSTGSATTGTGLLTGNNSRNAAIVSRLNPLDRNEVEYMGLYLADANTLFVVEEDTQAEVEAYLSLIIKAYASNYITPNMQEEFQYLLSENSAPVN